MHAIVRRPGGALAYAVYAVGATRALTDSVFPTDHEALLGHTNGAGIQLATAAEVSCYLKFLHANLLQHIETETKIV